jgi:hypothetical protein
LKKMIIWLIGMILVVTGFGRLISQPVKGKVPYIIVDTGQIRCYDNYTEIPYPKANTGFFGQDAHYSGNQPAYKDNGDGTVTDLNTGLMWTRDPGSKKTYQQATDGASQCRAGGYRDWRLPTIKELYSLILFSGTDPHPGSINSKGQTPFIDAKVFRFQYGKLAMGERIIDSQYATCTLYSSTTMDGNKTMFGVNFADGRIKGYPIGLIHGRREKTYYVMYVRGNTGYGKNDFEDNFDGTITDKATGLMWMKIDSGKLNAGKMSWQQALEWAENLEYAGYSDWRLPNAKELQSIVDYSRSPGVTKSAAIDPIFEVTSITNESGQVDYPGCWTGTTHRAGNGTGSTAVYISFGRAMGYMRGHWLDVHGAGAQRSDPKTGDPADYPQGRGPQGDAIRIYNYVRCVRGGIAQPRTTGPEVEMMQKFHGFRMSGQQVPGQNRGKRQSPSGEDFIRRFDRDGDGKVSREEFAGPRDHFDHFDKNGDGFISREESPKGPPANAFGYKSRVRKTEN